MDMDSLAAVHGGFKQKILNKIQQGSFRKIAQQLTFGQDVPLRINKKPFKPHQR